MALPHRITADAAAGLLLVGAATVLLATPYDGGSCRNVATAYALPAASPPRMERPVGPAGLADARDDLAAAEAEKREVETAEAEVERARSAAREARTAAIEAETEARTSSYSTGFTSASGAEYAVDSAESAVESAEGWLADVREFAASEWSAFTQSDIDAAQDDLDEARADLATAQAELAQAESEEAARETEAADAQATADQLDAAADAAEKAATDAANGLAARASTARDQLYAAQSRVAGLELDHDVAVAAWSHEQRIAGDEVTALNNVRESCRENGVWRAGVALLDIVVVAGLVLRRWAPRLPQPARLGRLWRRG